MVKQNLKILDCRGTNITDFSNFPDLEELDIGGLKNRKTIIIPNKFNGKFLNNLKVLNCNCTNINSVKNEDINFFKNLKELVCLNENITDFRNFLKLEKTKYY